jgi:hypothetical protein
VYQPGERVFAGTDPAARLYLCMWKGLHRINLMVDSEEGKTLTQLLVTGGYMECGSGGGGGCESGGGSAASAAVAAVPEAAAAGEDSE